MLDAVVEIKAATQHPSVFTCIVGFVDCRMLEEKSGHSAWMNFGKSAKQDVIFSLPLVCILAIFMLAYYVLVSDVYKSVHEKLIKKEVDDRLA